MPVKNRVTSKRIKARARLFVMLVVESAINENAAAGIAAELFEEAGEPKRAARVLEVESAFEREVTYLISRFEARE
jgi:hypothetical protein